MSLMHTCPRCGRQWETGLGGAEHDLCRHCRRVEDRLSNGGRGLTRAERGAVLSLHELVLTTDNELVRPTGEMFGSLVLTDDEGVIDAATLDGEKAKIVA